PLGVAGELAVAGAQLGRGYWNRPELTADRFVPDGFSPLPGQRLYRTGDLARWRPNGEIEFLGRLDTQVKVRGFRIELGDVEATLAAHPQVREAVVLAREDHARQDGSADRRLVAYVVAEPDSEPAGAELRSFLQGLLPEYMLPAAFVLLPALPLTANGKVDRKALPAPEAGAGAPGFVAPRTELERHLATLWADSLGLSAEQVGIHDSFFETGGNSILGAILVNRLQQTLGEIVHVVALFDHPTVAAMAAYLARDYPAAVARLWGLTPAEQALASRRVDTTAVELLREIIPPLAPMAAAQEKNPPAVFVLSAPRSGSTLLRVLLAGHSRLFAPPELELLSFNTMAERRAAFSGRNAFWLEGLLRAVMEIHRFDPEQARALVERYEAEDWPTRLVYRRLQEPIGERTLVDKTPSYALSRDALERAESDFDAPRYIHLLRHPNAVIRSFEEAKLDQVFFRHAHPFDRRELAELIWTVSHQNIVRFLANVPSQRQHWLRFEELVRDPQAELQRLCDFLALPFHPGMLQPYQDTHARMADGLHAQSRMLGDVKFLQHRTIDAAVGERWRGAAPATPLGEPTRELACSLGYQLPDHHDSTSRVTRPDSALVPLQAGGKENPLFLVHPIGGSVFWYLNLARELGPEQPVYGLRSRIQAANSPLLDLPSMAARYLSAVREIQEFGPYLLGGWSMGAVVAFEMARQLRAKGAEVARLIMIDPPRPQAVGAREEDEASLLAGLVGDLEGLAGRSLGLVPEDLEGLAFEVQLRKVLAASQQAGALSTELDFAHFREMFTIFQQNRHALSTFAPVPYTGRLTLFRARPAVAATSADVSDPSRGWINLASAGADVRFIDGDHYSILRPPAVARLAAQLAPYLDEVHA
ncbi:MAG TPA: thioesterase domain-containing protein, partial [Thermoanaerobaculia bacterium]|nr:thioesterase domain-containing protein [Thermoanaerobaculia bacterium]